MEDGIQSPLRLSRDEELYLKSQRYCHNNNSDKNNNNNNNNNNNVTNNCTLPPRSNYNDTCNGETCKEMLLLCLL